MTETFTPIEILCCYAHEDEAWLRKLETYLGLLRRQGLVSLWHDRLIVPGAEWANVIHEHLEKASIILLLISADFINTDYCYTVEMTRTLERYRANEAQVILVVVHPCEWQQLPILLKAEEDAGQAGKLQVLPINAQQITTAITTWSNQRKAFVNVVEGIRWAILRPVILADLEDKDEAARFAAAQALAAFKYPGTVPVIMSRLEIEPAPSIRYWLAYALGLIGGELAREALLNAKVKEKDEFAKKGIAAGLEELAKNQHTTARGGST
jgi:hypothetical protein